MAANSRSNCLTQVNPRSELGRRAARGKARRQTLSEWVEARATGSISSDPRGECLPLDLSFSAGVPQQNRPIRGTSLLK